MTLAPDSLAAAFPTTDRGQWHELVAKALARSKPGVLPADVEGRLGSPTDDGYTVKPLYTAADVERFPLPAAPGEADFRRGSVAAADRAGWQIRQRYWGTRDEIVAAASDGLANGVTGVWLTLLPELVSADDVPEILGAFDLTDVDVTLEGFAHATAAAEHGLAALADQSLTNGSSLGLDPIGLLAGTGRTADGVAVLELAERAREIGCLAYSLDATIYHDAGASFGEELGAATAAGLATLRNLTGAGFTVDQAAGMIEFRFAVTDDQFASIAKLRAARLLWSRVLEVAGASQERGQRQHAVTSWAMLTQRDPWVNLIRNTVACFAAGTGGADAVTVQPHSMAREVPDDLARRMARNTQHLLLDESHVGVVDDPLGGSWYGETRTRELAEAAWEWVQEIEGSGGMETAVSAGQIAGRIRKSYERESGRIARRRSPLTGVSEFPDRERVPVEAPSSNVFHRPGGGLPQHRWAEPFEALRDASDAAVASGRSVTVHLLTVGTRASFTPRLGFAQNLFAAGGIDTVEQALDADDGFMLERSESDAPAAPVVVCICGSDKDYAGTVSEWSDRLPEGATVWLAGKPVSGADAYGAAGVSGYLFAGCDALEVLRTTLTDLEVSL